MKKICSSESIEGLTTLINQYYFSSYWIINDKLEAYNTKLLKTAGKIELKRNKYTFYL